MGHAQRGDVLSQTNKCVFSDVMHDDGITSHPVIHHNDRVINMIDITLFPHISGRPKFSIFQDGKGWQTFVHCYLSEDMEK